MRIRSGVSDQYIYFVAVDATDYVTRETGLATWTVVRSRNGAADVTYTTPTITEIDAVTMPGVYALLLDEDVTLDAGDYTQEVALHITHSGMAPVTRTFELYTDAEGDVSDVLSRLTVTNSQILIIKSDTSDIKSNLTIIASDAAAIDSNVDKVYSDTTIIYSDTTTIQSDVTTLASDLAEGDFSDILSRLTVTNSQVLIIKSDTSDIKSALVIIASDTLHIESDAVAIETIVSDVQSDTNKLVSDATEVDASDIHSLLTLVRSDTTVIETVTSDIQSDTNVLITKMRGVVIATGTLGATGNSTTALHLDNAVFDSLSDTELNGYTVVIYDNSLDEYHTRTIANWTNVGDLATVATLPFTPEASVDLYWVLPPQSQQTPELDGDVSDVLSRLTVTNSQLLIVKSDTSDIRSALVIIASDAAAIDSNVDKVYSDTTIIYSDTTTIQSDTTTLASDLAEADFSDIHSRLTLVLSDTSDIRSHLTALTGATGTISDIASGVDAIQAAGGALTAAQDSKLTQIHSDTQPVGTLFEIVSDIYSDTTAIEAAGGALTAAQDSKLTEINSQVVRIHSDTVTLASDLAEGDFSDILSRLTVTNSQLLIVKSDTSDIKSALVIVASDVAHIESDAARVESKAVQIYSDTTIIYSDTTIISSDTALATDTRAEPGQGAPAATTTPQAKLDYLYKAWRNKTTQTSTTYSLYADDTTTVDQKATVSDDGATFTKDEVATGP